MGDSLISIDDITSKIILIRGQRVMLDTDLAELYGTTTKILNQAIKRNLDRFPSDFMFQLTRIEKREVVTNCENLEYVDSLGRRSNLVQGKLGQMGNDEC